MQKTNSISGSTQLVNIIDPIEQNKVAIVVTTILSAVSQANCSIYIYNSDGVCHEMKFELNTNETLFLDSKLFLPQGYSLKVQSDQSDTMFTVMYDLSINS